MGFQHSLDEWQAAPSWHGISASKFSKPASICKAHNFSVVHKSPVTHTIVYTGIAVTSVPSRNDTGEEDDSGLAHVCVVAWIDTTHCVANVGLLTSTASADTTYLALLALLYAAQWARNTFEPRDVPHKLLLFTD
ncbi:hypothetical protein HPB48_022575 [Haemaphysalis longicornis]|uniref:Uncharacterized protein n=1 Tax=Haemaphysalis longicornis TaxID=44386 RepID=A0A9J6H1D4_HAELO|nr:hypothetical protein HPB48_022575 [Haemaphysalis longicornis]